MEGNREINLGINFLLKIKKKKKNTRRASLKILLSRNYPAFHRSPARRVFPAVGTSASRKSHVIPQLATAQKRDNALYQSRAYAISKA